MLMLPKIPVREALKPATGRPWTAMRPVMEPPTVTSPKRLPDAMIWPLSEPPILMPPDRIKALVSIRHGVSTGITLNDTHITLRSNYP